jgi:hypothetical protein
MGAGAEYLDVAFGPREAERLKAIEEARQRVGSIWVANPSLWDGSPRAPDASSESPGGTQETTRSRTRPGRHSIARTCGCCGRAFTGSRFDAEFCGPVCQKRSRRGRCEEAV